MEINDEYVKAKFFSKNGKVIKSRIDNINDEERSYIENRYMDSLSFDESIHRIYYNIEYTPTCPICGKLRIYYKGSKFHSTCLDSKCIKELNSMHGKETCINKYGVDNYAKTEDNKKESRERYWKLHDQIVEKRKLTNIERYGVENCFQSEEKKEKIRQTCLEKYGYECASKALEIINKITNTQNKLYGHRFNPEKYKETCLRIYGVDNAAKDKDIQNKITHIQTQKYGSRFNPEKRNKTVKERYGVDHVTQIPEVMNKSINTAIKHHGALFNPLKTAETIINEYDSGYVIDNCSLHDLHVKNMHVIMMSNKMKNIIYDKKKLNGTFNTSKPEDKSYELIKEAYPDVIRQYKCDRYPFACDFYIPSIDTFIECQYSWTHGKHPYNKENKDDIELLESWKSKNKEYYNNAIDTWSIRDVNKRNIAIQNNLNYIEFWNINELKDWLKVTIN